MTTTGIRELQLKKFRRLLKIVLKTNRFYRKKYAAAGIKSAEDIRTFADFSRLPFTTKEELIADQQAHPPYGTNLTFPEKDYVYVTSTSGTTGVKRFNTAYTSQGFTEACHQEALWMKRMGITRNDRCLFVLPYALYPLLINGALEIGAQLLPGDGRTALDLLKNIRELRPTVLETSPSWIFHLIDVARESGLSLSALGVKKIILTGEAGAAIPALRRKVETAWHADCFDALGSTELGIYSYECSRKQGPHLLEDYSIFEVLDPQTSKPASSGELVGTSLWRPDFPFIRYRTGDFVRIDRHRCACGSRFPLLKDGIIGKVDGSIKIRAVSYYPTEFDRVIRQFPEISDYRAEIVSRGGLDQINLTVEVPLKSAPRLRSKLTRAFVGHFSFEPRLKFVPPRTFEASPWKTVRVVDRRQWNKLNSGPEIGKNFYTKLADAWYDIHGIVKRLLVS